MVGGPLWSPEFVTRRLLEHWVRPRRGEAPLQFPRELFEFKSGIRLRGAVLQRAADVDKCKGELEDDEGVGVVVPAPDDPEHVTNQEQPEAPVAFGLLLRTDHPGGDDRNHHGRPLEPLNHH